MKYSQWPTLIIAAVLYVIQFTAKTPTESSVYLVGIAILVAISITISTSKNEKT
mgnify:CR=1 FL=1